jgi:hypothetical protein
LGSAAGLANGSAWFAESNQAGAFFGFCVASAGDVNGDGYGDVIVGAEGYDNGETNEGRAFVYLGNEGRGGWCRALRQRTSNDARPIALLGQTASDQLFRILVDFSQNMAPFSWATAGTRLAYLEWEVKPLGRPFDGRGVQRSPIGTPLVPFAGPTTLDELVVPPAPAPRIRFAPQALHWRARIATNNPLFPNTAWFSIPGNNITETKLRTGRVTD